MERLDTYQHETRFKRSEMNNAIVYVYNTKMRINNRWDQAAVGGMRTLLKRIAIQSL